MSLTTSKLDWEAASRIVASAQSILVVTHMNPDGDAVGSLLGLANALRARGMHIDTAVDEGVPRTFHFLPGAAAVYPKLTVGDWDLLISVDSSDEERSGNVGSYGRKHARHVLNIDHHVTNTLFGDTHLVKIDSVSTTEVLFHWFQRMGMMPLSAAVAAPLLTGLVTDTLGFRTSNVTLQTLNIAQALVSYGASLTEVTARTLDVKPFSIVRLWSYCLQSVQLAGQVVSAEITLENLRRAELKDVSESGLVGLLNSVEEAMIAVVFQELESGKIKMSFRSKRGFDVGSVALALGGGGHTQASGATIDGPLAYAREVVMPLLQRAASEGSLLIV